MLLVAEVAVSLSTTALLSPWVWAALCCCQLASLWSQASEHSALKEVAQEVVARASVQKSLSQWRSHGSGPERFVEVQVVEFVAELVGRWLACLLME